MTTDFRALCAELVDELDAWIGYGDEGDTAEAQELVDRARAALTEQPVPVIEHLQEVHPFVVRHYTNDERPSIKGNGFDGLEIGENRQEAEEFIAWINKRICRTPAAQAVLNAYQCAPLDDEQSVAAVLRAAAEQIEDRYCETPDSDLDDSPGVVFAMRQLALIAAELEGVNEL